MLTVHLPETAFFLFEFPIDICLLDFNLNGKDGYKLLKLAVSGSFHTIVISANTDKAADIYVDANLKNGNIEILNKTMNRLEQILPPRLIRIHRSFLVDVTDIENYGHIGNGYYQVTTKLGHALPLSRQKYKELYNLLNH